VVRTIVVFPLFAVISFQIARRLSGSRPELISSSSSRFDPPAKAHASWSFRFCPPDKFFDKKDTLGARSQRANKSRLASSCRCAGVFLIVRHSSMCWPSAGKLDNYSRLLTCKQVNSSHNTSFWDAIPMCRSSAYRILPLEIDRSWAMADRVVLLAAPFLPS